MSLPGFLMPLLVSGIFPVVLIGVAIRAALSSGAYR